MIKEEMISVIQSIFENEESILAELYFILKKGEETSLRLIDVEETCQRELTKQFIVKVKQELLENSQLDIISISNADDRTNVIYEYDLDEIPKELTIIDEIIVNEDHPAYNFRSDNLEEIRGIIILFSVNDQNLVLYKKHYPISLIKKDNIFTFKRIGNNQRFVSLEEDIVKININFEFFRINDQLFIKDIGTLEKFFGFHDVIKRKAEECIGEIEKAGILDNPDVLKSLVDDISFSRKMTKILNSSPVLNKIPTNSIISFIESYPKLKGKFEYNNEKSKITLRTKKSMQLFVKLLNDDFLRSELTKLYYDSLAKDTLREEASNAS